MTYKCHICLKFDRIERRIDWRYINHQHLKSISQLGNEHESKEISEAIIKEAR